MTDLLAIQFTVTLAELAQPYLALVVPQLVAVTYAYLWGRGKDTFYNYFLYATVIGTVAAYLVLVYGPL